MRRTFLLIAAAAAALVAAVALCGAREARPSSPHPLLTYIARPDASYSWRKAGELDAPGQGKLLRLELASQTWHGITWKHELDLIRPEAVRHPDTAILFITVDHGSPSALQTADSLARATGMPVVALFDIPNQPLFDGKREDALIAYTLSRFLETGDDTWPLLFPMAKSAVRAMDAAQEVARKEWNAPLKGFVVSGASKRGWTAWLTAAADPRVVGVAPLVYDNLNLAPQMAQQLSVYGTYSSLIGDYARRGLPQLLAVPEGRRLAEMIDPYALRHRVRVPKLIINSINDPYWTLEAANLYFGNLPGEKHILYEPNAGHYILDRKRVLAGIRAFAVARANGEALPKLAWAYRQGAGGLELTIRPRGAPTAVAAWTASSDTRDFRKAEWTEQPLKKTNGAYTFTLAKPKRGYAAVFGEVVYGRGEEAYWLSTTPRISP
ncbi:MAG: hypothetical protein HY321_02800 [Armatimonadetes bacterium]|nr:hypothetical protein [Armatimonadota bacterium]